MAAFARGVSSFPRRVYFQLPPCLRTAAFQCRATYPGPSASLRFLSCSSPVRAAATKAAPAKPRRPAPTAAKAAPVKPYKPRIRTPWGNWQSNVENPASGDAPTILYQAPSQLGFRMVCYAAAFACFSASASTYQFFYSDSAASSTIAPWVPIAFGVIAVSWSCFGTYIAAAPIGVVKSITAVPMTTPTKRLALRMEIMQLPGMKNKVVHVAPLEVEASGSIGQMASEYAVSRKSVTDARAPRPDDPVVLKPFLALGRLCSRWLYSFVSYTKMSVMREGFVKLKVDGKTSYKLDSAGSFPKGGYVIDRLISVGYRP